MLNLQKRVVLVIAATFALSLFIFTIPHPVTAGNQVVINMIATIVKKTPDGKYAGGWDPRRITVSQGDEVLIRIKSSDAEHMFFLEGYNIEKDVSPGSPVEVRFVADKAGIFYYYCHMECGPLHKAMVGQLIVEPKKS